MRIELPLFGEEPVSLLTGEDGSVGLVGLRPDLNGDFRVGYQITVPVRVGWCTTFGREDKQAVAVGEIHCRYRVLFAAFGTGGCEQKEGSAFPHSTNFASVCTELFNCLTIPVVSISHNSSSIVVADMAGNSFDYRFVLFQIRLSVSNVSSWLPTRHSEPASRESTACQPHCLRAECPTECP